MKNVSSLFEVYPNNSTACCVTHFNTHVLFSFPLFGYRCLFVSGLVLDNYTYTKQTCVARVHERPSSICYVICGRLWSGRTHTLWWALSCCKTSVKYRYIHASCYDLDSYRLSVKNNKNIPQTKSLQPMQRWLEKNHRAKWQSSRRTKIKNGLWSRYSEFNCA